jgi:uncharacterized protein YjiS (DUF1127 family)
MFLTSTSATTRRDRGRPSLAGILRRVATAFDRASQRRTLAELTDDQLRDIGLTRTQADAEALKPLWR